MTPLYALVLAASVRVGVFGLFHPQELEVRAAQADATLEIAAGEQSQVLRGGHPARLISAAKVTGRGGSEAAFVLSVPGKIQREFHGRLEVRQAGDSLLAIVEMDRETAVASIVGAEAPDAPLEAQKAQAVVARSFLVGSGARHDQFDFCDTTHCQFLREPPRAGSAPARAALDTRGLAIWYQGKVVAALYSADCGGQTRTLEQAGWNAEPYPYFAIECPVRGSSSGHRIGYCQRGAAELARRGATFREIVAHYFPATELADLKER
jgi:peptidoglycan hydrolase-like amidase